MDETNGEKQKARPKHDLASWANSPD